MRGDLIGYLQAIADAMENIGILSNDKWVMGWDGSRLALDRDRPRVEIQITPLD
jgi:Holliday junction resolvase RusA-like endonuclease